MSLYENWIKSAYDDKGRSDKKFWSGYMPLEQAVYENILENKTEKITGTVSELGTRFNLKPEFVCGFVDGIKGAVVNNAEGTIDIESFDENTIVDFTIDFEQLYKKMVEYKAKHLYTLPQWNDIFTEEQREEFFTWQKKSGTFVREGEKTGRNDPCPCGSGKKYKKCCGSAE